MYFKHLIMIASLISSWPWLTAAIADSITLKDGTVEQSEKVWESDKYIHFILKGTTTVEIRYSKEIVERVDYRASGQINKKTPSNPSHMSAAKITADQATDSGTAHGDKATQKAPPGSGAMSDDKIVKVNKGLAFYDPRRAQRYWVSQQSKHNNLENALEALAGQYGRSSQWVEIHMGEENDLGIIHRNLIRQQAGELTGMPMIDRIEPAGEPDAAASIPADPVVAIDSPVPSAVASSDSVAASSREDKGIAFYDPRRAEKYWTGKMTRHDTLQDALESLAGQYHVSSGWIAEHMGDTNDLAEIHSNIQKSLPVDSVHP